MSEIMDNIGLTFDDVLLVPRYSDIESRFNGEIDLSTKICPNFKLKYPIISANMDTITELDMAQSMNSLGCLGIIHRFLNPLTQKDCLERLKAPRIICIGVGEDEFNRFKYIYEESEKCFYSVLIDVAHGHSKGVLNQIKKIKNYYEDIQIIAGNVATAEGARDLWDVGADCIKVGVGPGSLCTTRINTGHGVPQLTAIFDIYKQKLKYKSNNLSIIADGGIRNAGDIVKALAAGADAVMIGSLLAGTDECPGEKYTSNDGITYKKYRGMASREFQEAMKGNATSIEGESKLIPYKGPIAPIIESLINNLYSGMSYQNARNLEELRKNAKFIHQTHAGLTESRPHGLFL